MVTAHQPRFWLEPTSDLPRGNYRRRTYLCQTGAIYIDKNDETKAYLYEDNSWFRINRQADETKTIEELLEATIVPLKPIVTLPPVPRKAPNGLTEAKAHLIWDALVRLAAYDDEGANAYLRRTGSYAMFDEPSAVALARRVLSDLELAP